MQCPQCGNQNTQKSSALYEQGARHSEGESSGAFVTSHGTLGISNSTHSSHSSSLAADRNKPPAGASMRAAASLVIGIMISVLMLFMGGFGAFIFALISTGASTYFFMQQTEEDIADQTRYESQWYCRKCGSIFVAGKAAVAPNVSAPFVVDFVSPVTRATVRNDRKTFADRVLNPVQRTKKPTPRDLAGLAEIRTASQSDGTFHPEKLRCDLGIISRLASVDLITYDATSDSFSLMGPAVDEHPTIGTAGTFASPPLQGRGWWNRTFSGRP